MKNSSYMIGIAAIFLVVAFALVGFTAIDANAEPAAPDAEGAEGDEIAPSYKVEYKIGDKTIVSVVTPVNGATNLATLAGLGVVIDTGIDFVAWSDGATQYNAGSTYVYGEGTYTVTMTAVFKPVEYTAQFIGQDGTVLKTVKGTVANAQGAAVDPVKLSDAAPAAPAVAGYIFAGWAIADAKPVATEDLPALTADVKLIAAYTVDWNVTFIDGDKTYACVSSNVIIPDLGVREGFTFLGWFVGTAQVVDPAAYAFVTDTVFEAKWEPINCYVTFQAGEYKKTVPVLYGETVAELALPEGYAEWDFDFDTPIKGDVTITAVEAEAPEPAFYETPTGKCVIILAMFVVGFLIYQAYTGNLAEVLGKGKKKKTAKIAKPVEDDEDKEE